MRRISLRPHSLHASLAWLLWLAMLLPLAQSTASWHRYSHGVQTGLAQDEGKQAGHAAGCELCLSAAALSGASLPTSKSPLALLALAHALPLPLRAGFGCARPTLAYRSRAPPVPR
ncbi:hypothetical protein [Paucibacter soli]|uniref:hypothetical protein n=1 Tax=Paucibacter soli TaxID=3133433 RepID=UPI003095BD89